MIREGTLKNTLGLLFAATVTIITCREIVQKNISPFGNSVGAFLCLLFSKYVFNPWVTLVYLSFLKDFYFDEVIVIVFENT